MIEIKKILNNKKMKGGTYEDHSDYGFLLLDYYETSIQKCDNILGKKTINDYVSDYTKLSSDKTSDINKNIYYKEIADILTEYRNNNNIESKVKKCKDAVNNILYRYDNITDNKNDILYKLVNEKGVNDLIISSEPEPTI